MLLKKSGAALSNTNPIRLYFNRLKKMISPYRWFDGFMNGIEIELKDLEK